MWTLSASRPTQPDLDVLIHWQKKVEPALVLCICASVGFVSRAVSGCVHVDVAGAAWGRVRVSMCVHVCVFGSSVFVCLGLSVVLCVVVSPLPSSVSLVNSTSRCSKLIYQLCLSLTWRDGPLTAPPGWLEVGSAAKCPG